MAKPTTPPQNGDTQNDLLVAVLKNINGSIDFQAVADSMSLSSSGAAQKRVKRLFEKIAPGESILVGSSLGAGSTPTTGKANGKSGNDDVKVPETPKIPITPKTGSKRKAKEVHVDNDASDKVQEVDGTDETPSKAVKDEDDTVGPKKKAKTVKPRATKTEKTPRTTKPRAKKSPKNGKATVSDAIVVEDEADKTQEGVSGTDEATETQQVNNVDKSEEATASQQAAPSVPVPAAVVSDDVVKDEVAADTKEGAELANGDAVDTPAVSDTAVENNVVDKDQAVHVDEASQTVDETKPAVETVAV